MVLVIVVAAAMAGGIDPELILWIFLWFWALGTKTFSNPVSTVLSILYVLLSPEFLNSSAD